MHPTAAATFALEKNTLIRKQNIIEENTYSMRNTKRTVADVWFKTRPFELNLMVKKIVAIVIEKRRRRKYLRNQASQ